MKQSISKKKINIKEIFSLFAVMLFFQIIVLMYQNDKNSSNNDVFLMEQCWTDENGNTVSLNHLPEGEKISLSADVSSMKLNDKRFCLKSVDTFLEVYADGKLIYSYHPIQPKLLGISYGMYVHTISLPEDTAILTLQAEPIFHNTHATIENAVLEDSGTYISELYQTGITPFSRSAITMVIGILFLIIGITNRLLSKSVGVDFFFFGLMCAMLGFQGMNDTFLLQFHTQQPAIVRFLTYVDLMFLPYPAVAFFADATGNKESKLLPVMLFLCSANFIAETALTASGITDYYYMVSVSHITVAIGFAVVIYFIIHSVLHHKARPQLIHSTAIGLAVCIIGMGADMLRYHFGIFNGYSRYTRISILLFMMIMGIYLLREQNRVLEQKHQENMIFIKEITEAFAKVIDMKDKYTNGHSTRVAKYTAMLSKELGYDEETTEKYYRIALLHDIGKIGVPTEVLNKAGKLTDEEFEIIKAHSQKGYEVLKDISIMPELAIGAGSHHERPDGKGYPNGLKGDEIPRVAQIIAVADTFDAMYSNRPYRKRMNFDKAVSIIKEVSGTQLTSDVVDAFLRLVERGEFRAADDNGGGTTENIDNIHQNFENENLKL